MVTFYDDIIFTQRQIPTTLADMSDLSLLWKLRKNDNYRFSKSKQENDMIRPILI